MTSNFHVWYDPKKYNSYIANGDNMEKNNSNNVHFEYNSYSSSYYDNRNSNVKL